MRVSIVTIVYNNKECVSDCIESVLNQSYGNIEHIVIDGGSTDGTQQVIEKYRDSIAIYLSEKDNGLYDALNKGIKMASGDVIGILHSDDVFYDNHVVRDIANAFESSNADLVYANGVFVERDNPQKIKRVYSSSPFKKSNLLFGWIPLHTTIYVKSQVFKEYDLYNLDYSIASDYDISLRWFKNDKINKYFLDRYVVKMRLGGKSTTASLQRLKSEEDFQIIKKHKLPGLFTLFFKIGRKIPQYLKPYLIGRF
jgi:glycosyltransferase